jgi:hypothetical protein
MSSNVENHAFDQALYRDRFDSARERLAKTKGLAINWVSQLEVMAASEFIKIEPILELFPRAKGGEQYRLVMDIHTTAKRYGSLGISLRSESMRTDLSKLSLGKTTELLKPFFGVSDARSFGQSLQSMKRFNEQVAALSFLQVSFPTQTSKGPVLPRWIEAINLYGKRCCGPLESAFDQFVQLSKSLDDAIFEFNSTMGPVRYRSIRCSYTIDDFDPLGPSSPALKVVTSINPATRSRRYNLMRDFKKSLKKKRIGQKLRRQLGRAPDKSEVASALAALRPRMETEWITKDVIKACYLGRSIKDVFEAQENLEAAMQPWTVLRAQLQALLP